MCDSSWGDQGRTQACLVRDKRRGRRGAGGHRPLASGHHELAHSERLHGGATQLGGMATDRADPRGRAHRAALLVDESRGGARAGHPGAHGAACARRGRSASFGDACGGEGDVCVGGARAPGARSVRRSRDVWRARAFCGRATRTSRCAFRSRARVGEARRSVSGPRGRRCAGSGRARPPAAVLGAPARARRRGHGAGVRRRQIARHDRARARGTSFSIRGRVHSEKDCRRRLREVAAKAELPFMESQINWDEEGASCVSLLRDLIRIPTVNPPGNERPAAERVAEFLRGAGVEPKIVEAEPGRASLVARYAGTGELPPLLLNAHLDVVEADEATWTRPPFSADVADGCIWGRGAVDMKNMVSMSACVLALLARTKPRLRRDVIFAAVADEETGSSQGAHFLVSEHPDLVRAEYALGELGGFSLHFMGRVFYRIPVPEQWQ